MGDLRELQRSLLKHISAEVSKFNDANANENQITGIHVGFCKTMEMAKPPFYTVTNLAIETMVE